MIKWSEFREGDVLYEAFLPEHEHESCDWLVRASCRGHVLGERRLSLTWPPRFGPDAGDVAAVDALADTLVTEWANVAVPDTDGPYIPVTAELAPVDPIVHAILHALVEEYAQAATALGVNDAQKAAYLDLPVRAPVRGLFPFAVTPERDGRMRRLIALDQVLKNRAELRAIQGELLDAVLARDILRLRAVLAQAGVDLESEATPSGSE